MLIAISIKISNLKYLVKCLIYGLRMEHTDIRIIAVVRISVTNPE